ncbi:hypothetical protein ABE83_05295 [Streptomyces sp. CFMR 7]|nr:hypothetical protein ABE83_05295 [Streptomyces sp. CFMR 7]
MRPEECRTEAVFEVCEGLGGGSQGRRNGLSGGEHLKFAPGQCESPHVLSCSSGAVIVAETVSTAASREVARQ